MKIKHSGVRERFCRDAKAFLRPRGRGKILNLIDFASKPNSFPCQPYLTLPYLTLLYCTTPLAWVEIQCFALTAYAPVQFDQLPEASWTGFWLPGASWAGFLAPKSLPGGEQGTPRKTNPTVQLFNLISFLEPPGLDSRVLGVPGLDSGFLGAPGLDFVVQFWPGGAS